MPNTLPQTARWLWAGVGLCLLAAAVRAAPLMLNRFHPDEALYASFALRIVSLHDPLLSGVIVDKPPLTFYLNALSTWLMGRSELALRLPSFFAGVLTIAAVMGLARTLSRNITVGALAGLALALSPLAVAFSTTLFMDSLTTLCITLALGHTARRRDALAALCWALAVLSKQTALLAVPLAPALMVWRLPTAAGWRTALAELGRGLAPLLVGLGLATALMFGWDTARAAPIGFWEQGYSDNAPGRLIRANEVAVRGQAWLSWLFYLGGSPLANGVFVAGWLAVLAAHSLSPRPNRAALADLIVSGYLLAYLGAYWLWAFNVWDRYLVQLTPLFAVLAGRLAWLAAPKATAPVRRAGLAVLLTGGLLMPGALTAARAEFPIGGDHGAYLGIDDMARHIRQIPFQEQAVLYDFWLSWQWGYYLYEGPVYVAWMPSPAALARDVQAFGTASPRYLVVPSWESETETRAALAAVGHTLHLRHTSHRPAGSAAFRLYQILPEP